MKFLKPLIILAVVGGRDYRQSKFNRALQGDRQIGSTIKPFVYAAAIEDGVEPDDMMDDRPVQFGNWSPRNSNGRYAGPVTVRDAWCGEPRATRGRSVRRPARRRQGDIGG